MGNSTHSCCVQSPIGDDRDILYVAENDPEHFLAWCKPGCFESVHASSVTDYERYLEDDGDIDHVIPLSFRHRTVFAPHSECGRRFDDYYEIEEKIGSGCYADVHAATLKNSTGAPRNATDVQRVAVKVFAADRSSKASKLRCNRRLLQVSFQSEVGILARLQHPHIVRLVECFDGSSAHTVLELCEGGELYSHIVSQNELRGSGGLDESLGRHFFAQMLRGVGYLHTQRIVHRDIKTENFLLLGDGLLQHMTLKLCDFGTAVVLSDRAPRALGRVGTLSYTAPEVYAERGATIAADAWSLGVVLYVMLVAGGPFRGSKRDSDREVLQRIESGSFDQRHPAWSALSKDARDLVCCLVIVEESDRFTCQMAASHKWTLKGGRSQLVYRSSGVLASHALTVLSALRRFVMLDRLQQLVLVAYVQTIPEAELLNIGVLEPWYEVFFELDSDGDGRLNAGEFVHGFRKLCGSVSSEEAVAMWHALDVDGSFSIEWSEWLSSVFVLMGDLILHDEHITAMMRSLGKTDGLVTAVELTSLLPDTKDFLVSTHNLLPLISRWHRTQEVEMAGEVREVSLTHADLKRLLVHAQDPESDRHRQ
mmetsp:Transcript_4234/g.11972  ORF Transcript_4234/g.11972 Transcript_4234/m.11972 type:complete len:594 (-) Transcript_4234:151-1932(-)|eukprot:CAMPEP_0194518206 /NCGR_PEP_ID=MMETSP0253-20130528/51570_1 /TAXON_ID=2966 /ORGANISM="Noctiluca scintillans" /LENGTH=593 /DNA_ID=CAMNT_0039362233 /DNA_START=70 /DNA_END=1851 /DNA_ORIENTATION=-